jgi:TolB-like protein
MIAVLNFGSASPNMSNYVLEELNDGLVNQGNLIVVDRRNLAVLQQEMNFQQSGEVSDETAQAIGRRLGAQMVVSGSLSILGSSYRFRIQALEVETAVIKYSQTQNVQNDRTVQTLMAGSAAGVDFTMQERVGAAALNLVFGMGSFILQKDNKGGGKTALFESIGIVGMVTGLIWYNIESNYYRQNYVSESKLNETTALYPFYIGMGFYAGGAIYGIVRAITYQKPGTIAVMADQPPWNIALVPDSSGNAAVQLSYTLRF